MESSVGRDKNINWTRDLHEEEISGEEEKKINDYIGNFSRDFYEEKDRYGYSISTSESQFNLVQKLMNFLRKNHAQDRLPVVISNVYREFIVDVRDWFGEDYYESNAEVKKEAERKVILMNLQTFARLHKMTGVGPPADLVDYNFDDINGINKIFYYTEAKVFNKFLLEPDSLDKNFGALEAKLQFEGEDTDVEMLKYLLEGEDKEKVKQACYTLLKDSESGHFNRSNFEKVALFKKATGIELSIDPQLVQKWYEERIQACINQFESENPDFDLSYMEKEISDIRIFSGIAADFTQHALSVQKMYDFLAEKCERDYDSRNILGSMLTVKRLTNIKPVFNSLVKQAVSTIAVKEILYSKLISSAETAASIRKLFDNAEEIKKIQEKSFLDQLTKFTHFRSSADNVDNWFPILKSFFEIWNDKVANSNTDTAAFVSALYENILSTFLNDREHYYNIDDAVDLIDNLERVSGIKRNFNPEDSSSLFFKIIQTSLFGRNFSINSLLLLKTAEKLVGRKAVFDIEQVQGWHRKLIIDSFPDSLSLGQEKSAELEKATGIPRHNWTEEYHKQLGLKVINAKDVVKSAADAEALIGSQLDFSLISEEIFRSYDNIFAEILTLGNVSGSAIEIKLNVLERTTGMERKFSDEALRGKCDYIIAQNKDMQDVILSLGFIRMFVGRNLLFTNKAIQDKYAEIVKTGNRRMMIGALLMITGVDPVFEIDPKYYDTIIDEFIRGATTREDCVREIREVASITKTDISTDLITAMLVSNALKGSFHANKYKQIIEIAPEFGLEIDWTQVAVALKKRMAGSPNFILALPAVLGVIDPKRNTFLNDPWLAALTRMWTTESGISQVNSGSFIVEMMEQKALSVNESSDADVVSAFIDDFGITSSADLYKLYSFCYKKNDFARPPEQAQAVITDLFGGSIAKLDDKQMTMADKASAKFSIEPDWSAAVRPTREILAAQPRDIVRVNDFFANLSIDKRRLAQLRSAYEQDPWVSALNKLRKIQGINANEANDPWAQEFQPLLASLFEGKILSVENESDGSLIVEYVKRMGMLNIPKTCQLFIECQRAKSFEELTPNALTLLENFGINLRRSDGAWRFPSPRSVVNELEKAMRVFNSALLDDRIPDGLITELGEEQFSQLIGKTKWNRSDKVGDLVKKWQKTVARHPELAIIPNGFEPSSFIVGLSAPRQEGAAAKEADDVAESRIEKEAGLLKSKEALDVYMPLALAIQIGLMNFSRPVEWWGERKAQSVAALEKQISELQNWLAMTPQAVNDLVSAETDPEKKNILLKKQKAVTNEKGRQGMVKQVVDTERIKGVAAALEIGEGDDAELVGALTALAPFSKSSSEITSILSELSALHMVGVATEGWRAQLSEQFLENITPSAKRIEFIANFVRQYIFEHYLNKNQVPEHIGHAPFDGDLRKALERAWQQQLDKKGLLPIEQLFLKFKTEVDESERQNNKNVAVDMLPMAGLLRIYSGDIGDACYTSQHHQLANGDFSRVRAWIYASGSEKKLRGSLLGIETTRDDGVSALVARANNPQENFIRTVSADQFVVNSLLAVVDTARRIRDDRIKMTPLISEQQKRQCAVIPMDRATQSSTNRGPVAEVNLKRFGNLAKIGLKNEPETNFNSYAVWNKNSSHACVTIWEIDENGKETWYGDWDLEKKNK